MKKWVVECIWSIKNEIEVDKFLYSMCERSAAEYAYTPRPSKWISKFSSSNFILKTVLQIVRSFWSVGLGAIFSFWELLKWHQEWRKCSSYNGPLRGEFGLGYSDRAYEIIPKAIKRSPEHWIIFPWNEPELLPAKSRTISFLSLVTKRDFLLAFSLSRQVHRKMLKDKNLSKHIMQNYVAFRWILVRVALSRLEGSSFYTAEHFDRWAVMADRLKNLTLIQHGALGGISKNTEFPFALYYKLKNVRHLFIFNQQAEKIFVESILERLPLKISNFKLSIELQEVNDDKLSVLFIGHTLCENFQIALFQKIVERKEVLVFYKPHPLSNSSESISKQGWKVIKDKTFFPRVDIVVSYPSTLVDEYALWEIPAVVHAINADLGNVEEVQNVFELITNKIKT